jgi:lambda repressor-like predicted transcriptional regulator
MNMKTAIKQGQQWLAVDWVAVMEQLRTRGMTLADIERKSGIADPTLRAYAEGLSHPAHWRGERLIALWCVTTNSPREQVPEAVVYVAPRVMR